MSHTPKIPIVEHFEPPAPDAASHQAIALAAWGGKERLARPTINDVARKCGLSKATVSKALNLSPEESPVREETRLFVLEVAKEMGYRPNFRARSLSQGRSHAIGLLHDRPTPMLHGVYETMIYALAQTLLESGYHLTMVPTVGRAEEWSQALMDARLDGCVLFNELTPTAQQVLERAQLPTVLVNAGIEDAHCGGWPCLSVDPDDDGGTDLVVHHLLELGHTRIAYWENPSVTDHPSRARRRERFFHAMQQAGHEDAAQVCVEPVEAFIARLLPAARPTALVAYDHTNAITLLHALWQQGLQVPRDFSLATFNDVYPIAHLTPPLTTVCVPSEAMGRAAAQMLLQGINSGSLPSPHHLVLPETLIIRQSTAAL